MVKKDDDGRYLTELPTKRCTEADYLKFWPVDPNESTRLQNLKKSDSLFCIDWTNEAIELYGVETRGGKFQSLDIQVVPCHVTETVNGKK